MWNGWSKFKSSVNSTFFYTTGEEDDKNDAKEAGKKKKKKTQKFVLFHIRYMYNLELMDSKMDWNRVPNG